MISVDVTQTIGALTGVVQKADKALNKALKISAMEFSGHIKDTLNRKQSSGRAYRRRSVVHVASAPGYAPNSDTGYLAFSTSVSRRIKNNTVEVIIPARYARSLEFGTRNMKPRPFVRPARQALGFKIGNRIRKAISSAT